MSWLMMRQTGVDPGRRAWHSLEVTPVGGKMILFGGFDGEKYHNDVLLNDRGSLHPHPPSLSLSPLHTILRSFTPPPGIDFFAVTFNN
jgi:hypothetical protein